MTDCKYCGDRAAVEALGGYCSRRCATDAPAARERLARLLAGELPPPSVARTLGVDEIAVEIVTTGVRRVPLNQTETEQAVARMVDAGLSTHVIADRMGRARRTVTRYRNRLGINEKAVAA